MEALIFRFPEAEKKKVREYCLVSERFSLFTAFEVISYVGISLMPVIYFYLS
jgi:hypothetical protein